MNWYEKRLVEFAAHGRTAGFRLPLWDGQAKKLRKEGVALSGETPTGTKGKKFYDIDFPCRFPEHFLSIYTRLLWKTSLKVVKTNLSNLCIRLTNCRKEQDTKTNAKSGRPRWGPL